MKKLVVLFLLIGCLGVSAFAFDIMSYPPPVSGGNILIDAGVGLGFGYEGKLKIPPLFAQVEYALPQVPISVGGGISFWQNGWDTGISPYNIEWTYNYLTVMARGNWHWGFNVNWLDLYSGIAIGYRSNWNKYKLGSGYSGSSAPISNYDYSGLDWGLQFGAHFYFTPKVGAMVELGYPMMRVGVAFKL